MDVDHILPRSRGGTDHPNKLQLLYSGCNRSKGGKAMAEWRTFNEWDSLMPKTNGRMHSRVPDLWSNWNCHSTICGGEMALEVGPVSGFRVAGVE